MRKSGASNIARGLSFPIRGGPHPVEENGRSWGGGILKTVDVEQNRISVPEPARLSRMYTGAALPTRHSQEV